MTRSTEMPVSFKPIRHPPLWLIGLITLSGTLAMHVFVPALPSAGTELHASPDEMRLTITLYVIGLALGQLVYGPVADRFGRRPALLVGLVTYGAACVGAGLSSTVTMLTWARLAQGLGGCAGLILGRAIIRDLSGPRDAAQRLAVLNLMMTAGPGLAPILGGFISTALGWRAIFAFLALLALILIGLTWRILPETRPALAAPSKMLAREYAALLRSPRFLGFAIGGGCATTSMYGFIASSPFIFAELGKTQQEAGFYIALLVMGLGCGSVITSRLVVIAPLRRILICANAASLIGAAVWALAIVTGHLTVNSTVACMFVFTVGAGIASPVALTFSLGVKPSVVGSASGLYGCLQMAVGALCSLLAGLGPHPALSTAIVLVGAGLAAQLSFGIATLVGCPEASSREWHC